MAMAKNAGGMLQGNDGARREVGDGVLDSSVSDSSAMILFLVLYLVQKLPAHMPNQAGCIAMVRGFTVSL